MESVFTLIIALASIVGGFAIGLAGIFLNYRYPKSEHERLESEVERLRRELQRAQTALADWRARAENCEGMVQRMVTASGGQGPGSGISISDSNVTVQHDIVGGDATKRDATTIHKSRADDSNAGRA